MIGLLLPLNFLAVGHVCMPPLGRPLSENFRPKLSPGRSARDLSLCFPVKFSGGLSLITVCIAKGQPFFHDRDEYPDHELTAVQQVLIVARRRCNKPFGAFQDTHFPMCSPDRLRSLMRWSPPAPESPFGHNKVEKDI